MIRVDTGHYRVQAGDNVTSISKKLFGDGRRSPELLDANPLSDFAPGDVIEVPGFTGVVVTARKGEQFPSLHRRAFNNPAAAAGALDEFFKWNGRGEVEAGDEVFFVDLRRKTYGY